MTLLSDLKRRVLKSGQKAVQASLGQASEITSTLFNMNTCTNAKLSLDLAVCTTLVPIALQTCLHTNIIYYILCDYNT